jgi:hypothetical protein
MSYAVINLGWRRSGSGLIMGDCPLFRPPIRGCPEFRPRMIDAGIDFFGVQRVYV